MNAQQLVAELIDGGMTESGIGEVIGLSQAQVHRIKTGETKETNWSAGDRLISLHKSRKQKAKASAA